MFSLMNTGEKMIESKNGLLTNIAVGIDGVKSNMLLKDQYLLVEL